MENSFNTAHRKALKKLFDQKMAESLSDFCYCRELDKESFLVKGGLVYLSQEGGWHKSILIKTPANGGEALFEPYIAWAKTFDEIKRVSRYGDTIGQNRRQIGDAGCMPIEQLWDSKWIKRRDRYFGTFSFSTRDWGFIDLMEGRKITYSIKEATADVLPAFDSAWAYIDKYVRFFFGNIDKLMGLDADALDVEMEALMVRQAQ